MNVEMRKTTKGEETLKGMKVVMLNPGRILSSGHEQLQVTTLREHGYPAAQVMEAVKGPLLIRAAAGKAPHDIASA